jgi:hypothetical protein
VTSKLKIATLTALLLAASQAQLAQSQDVTGVERVYETDLSDVLNVEAAVLPVKVRGRELLIIAAQNGTIVALDPPSGDELWRVSVPTPSGERPELNATPAKVGKLLFVAYVSRAREGSERRRHLVAAIELSEGRLAANYLFLELNASKPGNDGGTVVFNPPTALSRAALAAAGRGAGTLGQIYVSFGNPQDVQPWHGWVFEIDIDAWRQGGPERAVSAVLLTTPESDCPVEGESGSTRMICGAGVWNLAGPQVVRTRTGYDLLVTTGNGELNPNDRNYAQSVLRLRKGLDFDPECSPEACADFNPDVPAEACLRSCTNIAIPRLLPDDPPVHEASERCGSDRTFMQCLAVNDWDLGANGAAQVRLSLNQKVIVQPGKDGGLYLFDAARMGLLHDREQIVEPCGTPEDPCGSWSTGMMRTQPVVTALDEDKAVIVVTFVPDQSHPAGVVARKIVIENGKPQFERLWEAPPADSDEAIERFRSFPSLPILTRAPDGSAHVWVVDTTGEDTLIGVRVSDGAIVVRQPLGGTVDSVRPGYRNGIIYVVSSGGLVEAFRIRYDDAS